MNMPIIYSANFPNGKKYIGVTNKSLESRINSHKNAYKRIDNKFYRALNKYGFDNMEFKEIKKVDTMKEAFKEEIKFIKENETNTNGYNTTTGGEGCPGRISNDSNRFKIAIAQKIRFQSEEQRKHQREKTYKWLEENKEKHKELVDKRKNTMMLLENRKKASEKQLAYISRTKNYKQICGERIKKIYEKHPEIKEKISRSLGGKPIEVYKEGILIRTFPTISECGRELNLNIGNVQHVLKGNRNHTGGYTFKRKEE